MCLLSGGKEPDRRPSHSSVTMVVMVRHGPWATRRSQRASIGWMWPRPGNGMATKWRVLVVGLDDFIANGVAGC